MLLRNKITDEIIDLSECIIERVRCSNKEYIYDSWEKFTSEWEEYKPEVNR